MSTDLHEHFATLKADADQLRLPDVEAVTARGRRWRWRSRGLAGALAVATVAALAWGGSALLPPPQAQPRPAVPAPYRMHPLVEVNRVSVGLPAPRSVRSRVALSEVADGRAFTTWHDRETKVMTIAATDLATGANLWGPHDLGRFGDWAGFIATAAGVVVIGEHDDGSVPDKTLIVIDPATGAERWRKDVDLDGTDLLLHETALILAVQATGRTEALDWTTGKARWTVTDPSGSVVASTGMVDAAELDQPGAHPGQFLHDPHLLELGGDGVLRTYDIGSGRLSSSGQAGSGTHLFGYDGRAYLVQDATTVVSYPVGSDGAALTLYRASAPVTVMTACGPRRLCVATSEGVVAIDAGTGTRVWRVDDAGPDWIEPAGERLLATGAAGAAAIYGPDGALRLDAGAPGRIDRWYALLLVPSVDGNEVTTAVSAVSLADGTRQGLGSVPGTGCAWGSGTLVCPTATGIGTWRYVG